MRMIKNYGLCKAEFCIHQNVLSALCEMYNVRTYTQRVTHEAILSHILISILEWWMHYMKINNYIKNEALKHHKYNIDHDE